LYCKKAIGRNFESSEIERGTLSGRNEGVSKTCVPTVGECRAFFQEYENAVVFHEYRSVPKAGMKTSQNSIKVP
jgi:hypothetical protein